MGGVGVDDAGVGAGLGRAVVGALEVAWLGLAGTGVVANGGSGSDAAAAGTSSPSAVLPPQPIAIDRAAIIQGHQRLMPECGNNRTALPP
jgi:hypothetical protein